MKKEALYKILHHKFPSQAEAIDSRLSDLPSDIDPRTSTDVLNHFRGQEPSLRYNSWKYNHTKF